MNLGKTIIWRNPNKYYDAGSFLAIPKIIKKIEFKYLLLFLLIEKLYVAVINLGLLRYLQIYTIIIINKKKTSSFKIIWWLQHYSHFMFSLVTSTANLFIYEIQFRAI